MPPPDANGCSVGSSRHASGQCPNSASTSSESSRCASIGKSHRAARPRGRWSGDQRDELLLDLVEDPPYLGRLHPLLVVVEEHVVRLIPGVEALDVLEPQVEVPLERGQERAEVRRLLRLCPHLHPVRAGARHLRAQVGRHAHRLLVVAPRDAVKLASNGSGSTESSYPRSSSSSLPVSSATKSSCVMRESVASCSARAAAPALGNDRLVVPVEKRGGAPDVVDLGETGAQPLEYGIRHVGTLTATVASTSTGMPAGNSFTPSALRAHRPRSSAEHRHDEIGEAVQHGRLVAEPRRRSGQAEDLHPPLDDVERAELVDDPPQGQEPGRPCRLVALLDGQVGTDDAGGADGPIPERYVPVVDGTGTSFGRNGMVGISCSSRPGSASRASALTAPPSRITARIYRA